MGFLVFKRFFNPSHNLTRESTRISKQKTFINALHRLLKIEQSDKRL